MNIRYNLLQYLPGRIDIPIVLNQATVSLLAHNSGTNQLMFSIALKINRYRYNIINLVEVIVISTELGRNYE